MAKTVTLPVPVNINMIPYPAGTYVVSNDAAALEIVQVISRYNDGQAYVTRKGRGTFVEATAV